MQPQPHHLAEYWANAEVQQKILKTKLCMAESTADPCASRIVHAHTIPRSQMQQIATDGHVYAMSAGPADLMRNDGRLVAKEIGINKFSVLNCFCAKNDNDLFAPIEDEPLVFHPKQLAYRTIASEFYRKVMGHRLTLHRIETEAQKKPRKVTGAIRLLRDYAYGEQLGIRDLGPTFALCEKEVFSETHDGISALVVHFKNMPTIMTVGGFLPECDYNGKALQTLGKLNTYCQGVSFNILASQGHAALAMLWFKGQNIVRAFAEMAQKPEYYSTLAIQTAFEHLENTCMAPSWWLALRKVEQNALLRRMQAGGSPFEERRSDCLTFCGIIFDQWEYDRHELINA
jgi:hypothetical protein